MTRLTEVCHKFKKTQIKKFTNYRGPTPLLKWVRPAELKDEVSVRKKIKEKPCLQEMDAMLRCLRDTDLSETKCAAEIVAFHQCNKDYEAKQKQREKTEGQGRLYREDTGMFDPRALNAFLKKNPQPREKSYFDMPHVINRSTGGKETGRKKK